MHIKEVKVSVLIYVLNDQPHIEKCVRSVMDQSLQEIEIILIDGGSTDRTPEIIEQLRQEDERIKLIQSDSGVGCQFNTGLRAAKGKYIGICESDDYLASDMYLRQYEIAVKYDLDVLKANVLRFCEDENGEEYSFLFSLSADRTMYNRLLYPQEDRRFLKLGVNGFWSGLYRREFLEDNALRMNETTGASYQDITFSFLTELYAVRAYVMSDAFYCYRMDNPNSSVNNPRKSSLLNTEYDLLKEQLQERGVWEQNKEIYWSWRTSGYLWFYDNMSDTMREEFVPVLYHNIIEQVESEAYAGTELGHKEEELCRAALCSFEELRRYLLQTDQTWGQTQIRLLDSAADIVIFGTGNLGLLVKCYLERIGRPAAAGIDNAVWKWNTVLDGLKILPPEEGVEKYPDAVYIIANVDHGREMLEQIRQFGVREDNIIVCSHYDLFLKKMLISRIKSDRGIQNRGKTE